MPYLLVLDAPNRIGLLQGVETGHPGLQEHPASPSRRVWGRKSRTEE
jgi:hypothetical protein